MPRRQSYKLNKKFLTFSRCSERLRGKLLPGHNTEDPSLCQGTELNKSSWYRWQSSVQEGPEVHISHPVTNFEFLYEPFYVAPDTVPPHDERFVGYGYTRNTQVCSTHVPLSQKKFPLDTFKPNSHRCEGNPIRFDSLRVSNTTKKLSFSHKIHNKLHAILFYFLLAGLRDVCGGIRISGVVPSFYVSLGSSSETIKAGVAWAPKQSQSKAVRDIQAWSVRAIQQRSAEHGSQEAADLNGSDDESNEQFACRMILKIKCLLCI